MFRKLLFRFLKPRGYWHNRNYDPTFKMDVLENGDNRFFLQGRPICEAKQISKLEASDKTACIIASGPSIKTIKNTSQFKHLSCACVNGSYALAEQFGFVDAEKVKVNQSGGHVYLPLVIDDSIPPGCVWISAAVQSSVSLGDIYGPVELEKI